MLKRTMIVAVVAAFAFTFASTPSHAAEWGLKKGKIELKSPANLAFGPDHVLFIGDAKTAMVYALDVSGHDGDKSKAKVNSADLPKMAAQAIKAKGDAQIDDIAVNPENGIVYVALTVGDRHALIYMSGAKLTHIPLDNVKMAKTTLPNVPEDKVTGEGRRKGNKRLESITYLAYHENKVYVSGLTNRSAPSGLREISFPFIGEATDANIEFYHGAHGRQEDYPAARAFVPFMIDGKPNLLAGFTCTPLVRFPVKDLRSEMKITGTTVAELGNRNKPLDMIVYEQGGKHFLLIANSARGVMKVSTDKIGRAEGITERVGGGGIAGQEFETIKSLEGTTQLAKYNDTHAIVLIGDKLSVVPLP